MSSVHRRKVQRTRSPFPRSFVLVIEGAPEDLGPRSPTVLVSRHMQIQTASVSTVSVRIRFPSDPATLVGKYLLPSGRGRSAEFLSLKPAASAA